MADYRSDIAFTAAVKAAQEKRGSRQGYQRMAEKGDWADRVTDDLATFIAARRSFYFATANAAGQPYIQHRGGPAGFLKVLGEKTLGFADFSGNKQYISVGNLSENDKAYMFLMDYANKRRVKIWGRARIVEDDHDLLDKLRDAAYPGRPERAIIFDIAAWDVNCPQHIPELYELEQVRYATGKLQDEIADLQNQVVRLTERLREHGLAGD